MVRDAAGRAARGPRATSASTSATAEAARRRPVRDADPPGAWLEHSPILTWLVVALGGTYLVRYFCGAPEPLNAINLNIVNLSFLLLGFCCTARRRG